VQVEKLWRVAVRKKEKRANSETEVSSRKGNVGVFRVGNIRVEGRTLTWLRLLRLNRVMTETEHGRSF